MKALCKLGWRPQTDFQTLVRKMLEADLKAEGVELGLPVSSQTVA